MSVSLSKGGRVSLAKVAQEAGVNNLSKICVGLGWDVNKKANGFFKGLLNGQNDFDLDASAALLNKDGVLARRDNLVYYGNLSRFGVRHTGDNLTGAGDGDDEQIKINLNDIPEDIAKISFAVTIYQADTRKQNFGMVDNAYIRIFDEATGIEFVRFDLGKNFSDATSVIAGEVYRHNGEWKFSAIGEGIVGNINTLCRNVWGDK